MIREPTADVPEANIEDGSMRLVELGVAIVAVLAAVILAFIR
jgi:hypothetical protein